MEAYPDAKVLLTVRDPKKWYKSVHDTIYQAKFFANDFALRIYMWLLGKLRVLDTAQRCSCVLPKGFEKSKKIRKLSVGIKPTVGPVVLH